MKELLEKQIERYVVEVKQLRRRTSSSVSAIVADTLEGVIANLRDLVNEIKRTEKAEAKENKANASVSLTDAASKILHNKDEEFEESDEELDEDNKEFEEYEDYKVGTIFNSQRPRGYKPAVYDEDGNEVFSTVFVWKNEDDAIIAAKEIVDKKLFVDKYFDFLNYIHKAWKDRLLSDGNEMYLRMFFKK
jgi:hypothetical protein